MTNEQINRAVAEELGWKPRIHPHDGLWSMGDAHDNLVGRSPHGGLSEDHCWRVCNLNFTEDHNAVAEMRKAIREEEQNDFARSLWCVVVTGKEDSRTAIYWVLIASTPRQQCEAFLRMRGKWVE